MTSSKALNIQSSLKLPSGFSIPVLGFGLYLTSPGEARKAVDHALRSGYRHFDSATMYGNEAEAAAALLNASDKNGKSIPRENLFFTSKVTPADMSYDGAKKSVEKTLQKTGLDYVDLYLLHSPFGGKKARLGAWQALADSVAEGKIKSIGVSNYGIHHLEELESYIKETDSKGGQGKGGVLSINQVELHPWLARPDIVDWCKTRGVVLEAYCPLVRGNRMNDKRLASLAKQYNKKPAQVLLRWSVQMGFVTLPKSVTPSRIEENTAIYDFELSPEDMKTLDTGDYSPVSWDPTISRD